MKRIQQLAAERKQSISGIRTRLEDGELTEADAHILINDARANYQLKKDLILQGIQEEVKLKLCADLVLYPENFKPAPSLAPCLPSSRPLRHLPRMVPQTAVSTVLPPLHYSSTHITISVATENHASPLLLQDGGLPSPHCITSQHIVAEYNSAEDATEVLSAKRPRKSLEAVENGAAINGISGWDGSSNSSGVPSYINPSSVSLTATNVSRDAMESTTVALRRMMAPNLHGASRAPPSPVLWSTPPKELLNPARAPSTATSPEGDSAQRTTGGDSDSESLKSAADTEGEGDSIWEDGEDIVDVEEDDEEDESYRPSQEYKSCSPLSSRAGASSSSAAAAANTSAESVSPSAANKRKRTPTDRLDPLDPRPAILEYNMKRGDADVKEAYRRLRAKFGGGWKQVQGKGEYRKQQVYVNPHGIEYVLKYNPQLGVDFFLDPDDAYEYAVKHTPVEPEALAD